MQAPVFRILEGLAPYEETVTAMAAHAAAIRNGDAGEELRTTQGAIEIKPKTEVGVLATNE